MFLAPTLIETIGTFTTLKHASSTVYYVIRLFQAILHTLDALQFTSTGKLLYLSSGKLVYFLIFKFPIFSTIVFFPLQSAL